MTDVTSAIVAALVSGTVFSTVLTIAFQRRSKQLEADIKLRVDQLSSVMSSQRLWKERALTELLGPVFMQLDRTNRAFTRWKEQNLFLESRVIREGNVTIRDLLLQKGHLIPAQLREDAGKLVEHYDRWLEEYEKQRLAEKPDLDARFTFVGPLGYGFPKAAEANFKHAYIELWNQLYGGES